MECLAKNVMAVLLFASIFWTVDAEVDARKHHHHHHGHHHKHHRHGANGSAVAKGATVANISQAHMKSTANSTDVKEKQIVYKMQQLEKDLAAKEKHMVLQMTKGHFLVNAPLPKNFLQLFVQGVAEATGCQVEDVKLLETSALEGGKIDNIVFEAPRDAVESAEKQAADPDSKLANGPLHLLLLERDDKDHDPKKDANGKGESKEESKEESSKEESSKEESSKMESKEGSTAEEYKEPKEGSKAEEYKEPKEDLEDKGETPVSPMPASYAAASPGPSPGPAPGPPLHNSVIDFDTQMPFGDLEPFGREDTAQELTEMSIAESNAMVDQLERAEVAEEKRAVFRALTRLRGAAITSFDGVARSQTGNIDEYNKVHKWRNSHPLHHLAQEESDVSKWAFPNADF